MWLFVRWLPAVLMVSFLTLWSLVIMGDMARVLGWIMILSVAPGLALVTCIVVGIYAAVRRRVSRPMVVAWVLGVFVLWPMLWPMGVLAVKYPTSIDTEPSAVLRVPMNEPMRVYWGGEDIETNYHVLYPDQRFAFDLVVEPAGINSQNNEDFGCFGKTVVAPIDGKVVVAHDGEPDRPPRTIVDAEPYAGNHVVLELGSKTYLYLAHFQKGSVLVKPDDVVKAGTPIAKCGNSGRTSEPHIHVHHQRQDPRVYPFGFAEGLPIFFEGHDGPRLPRGGADEQDDTMVLTGDRITHVQTSTAPVE